MRVLLGQAVGMSLLAGVTQAREASRLVGLMVAPRKFMEPAALAEPCLGANRPVPNPSPSAPIQPKGRFLSLWLTSQHTQWPL